MNIILFIVILMTTCNAAAPQAEKVVITADEMQYQTKENISIAKGNARAESGEGALKKILVGDVLIGYFEKKSSETTANSEVTQSKLIKIEAKGNVVLTKGDTLVQADHCIYNIEKENAVCSTTSGKVVKITHLNHQLRGYKIEIDLKTEQYSLLPDSTMKKPRVMALISTDKKSQ